MSTIKQQKEKHKLKNSPIISNNLQDLQMLMTQLSDEADNNKPQEPTPQDKQASFNEYRNPTYAIVSLVGYLIGVDAERFGFNGGAPLDKGIADEADKMKEARIIRNLCRIRTAMEINYVAIVDEFRFNVKNIGSVPNLIPTDAVTSLGKDGVTIYKTKPDINEYLITINNEISNRINSISSLFPEWIKWEYIKPIFIMQCGSKIEGIKAAGFLYNSDRGRYPFGCWINWDAIAIGPCNKGNILYNDEKFVNLIYERNKDRFENLSLVRNAGNQTMRNLGKMLESIKKCIIVVDCENSDAVKLAAALSSLPVNYLSKISKVLLFDSEYTTDQWKTLVDRSLMMAVNEKASLELEHIVVPRLNQNKSQVDMTLAVRTSREVYTAGVDSVILASSDSDYWAMIQQLEGVKFLVMLEKHKTGLAIKDTLAAHEIQFCYIDDFCTAASYTIKTGTLISGIQERINSVLTGAAAKSLNVREMMDEVLQDSWITMTDKEKDAFYTRYLLHMKLGVNQDGTVTITIG